MEHLAVFTETPKFDSLEIPGLLLISFRQGGPSFPISIVEHESHELLPDSIGKPLGPSSSRTVSGFRVRSHGGHRQSFRHITHHPVEISGLPAKGLHTVTGS